MFICYAVTLCLLLSEAPSSVSCDNLLQPHQIEEHKSNNPLDNLVFQSTQQFRLGKLDR